MNVTYSLCKIEPNFDRSLLANMPEYDLSEYNLLWEEVFKAEQSLLRVINFQLVEDDGKLHLNLIETGWDLPQNV